MRSLGALTVISAGAIHLHEYRTTYGDVRTIGPLFLVNFVAAMVIGIGLLAPVEHVFGRWSTTLATLLALAGIGLAGGSYVMLLISEHGELFGFHEAGFSPTSIAATRYTEIAAVVLLAAALLARIALRPQRRW